MMHMEQGRADRGAFGAWLLTKKSAPGALGELATAAAGDRNFPRNGDADAVRAHLNRMQAPGEMFEAVDDAEMDWAAY